MLADCVGDLILRDTAHVASTAILAEKEHESDKKGCGAKMIAAVDVWVYFTDEEDPYLFLMRRYLV